MTQLPVGFWRLRQGRDMEDQRPCPVTCDPPEPAARSEQLQTSPEAAALDEVVRSVRDDCREDPKSYLDEVRVAAAGE